jgi:hypothetical protein
MADRGVMLCERPGASAADAAPGRAWLPSSTAGAIDPVGLVPPHKVYQPSLAPKIVSATTKHKARVKAMIEGHREAAQQQQLRAAQEAAKAENVTAFNAQLRASILAGSSDDVAKLWRPVRQAEAIATARASPRSPGGTYAAASPSPERKQQLVEQSTLFVDELVGQVGCATRKKALQAPSHWRAIQPSNSVSSVHGTLCTPRSSRSPDPHASPSRSCRRL